MTYIDKIAGGGIAYLVSITDILLKDLEQSTLYKRRPELFAGFHALLGRELGEQPWTQMGTVADAYNITDSALTDDVPNRPMWKGMITDIRNPSNKELLLGRYDRVNVIRVNPEFWTKPTIDNPSQYRPVKPAMVSNVLAQYGKDGQLYRIRWSPEDFSFRRHNVEFSAFVGKDDLEKVCEGLRDNPTFLTESIEDHFPNLVHGIGKNWEKGLPIPESNPNLGLYVEEAYENTMRSIERYDTREKERIEQSTNKETSPFRFPRFFKRR